MPKDKYEKYKESVKASAENKPECFGSGRKLIDCYWGTCRHECGVHDKCLNYWALS